jgi:hypothetical protein
MLIAAAACGRSDAPEVAAGGPARDDTFVGCVAQTGQPDVFLLSVVEPRNKQEDLPAGTAVSRTTPGLPESTPRDSELNPVSTLGPGSGPTTTTKIETYRLVGNGGLDLRAQVGRMLEVIGDVQRTPGEGPDRATPSPIGELHVRSARQLADGCPRETDGTPVP